MAEIFYSGQCGGQVSVREGTNKRPLDPRFDLVNIRPLALVGEKGPPFRRSFPSHCSPTPSTTTRVRQLFTVLGSSGR